MSDRIFITSVLLFVVWGINYFLWNAPVIIHALLVLAFLGTLISVYLDDHSKLLNRD